MPFVLLVIGAVFLVAGFRGTHTDYTVGGTSYPGLFTLIKGDFTGDANFLYWFAAIFLIGCVGYVRQLKSISDGFILLVIVSMFVAKSTKGTAGGFFQKAIDALKTQPLGPVDGSPSSNPQTSIWGSPSPFSFPLPSFDSSGNATNFPFPDSSL
jgi:hypothetical protein